MAVKLVGTSRPAAVTKLSVVSGTNVVNAAPKPAVDKSNPEAPSIGAATTVPQPPPEALPKSRQ